MKSSRVSLRPRIVRKEPTHEEEIINHSKTLNLKLRLKKFGGKNPEQGEIDIRILLETMSLSISKLILKYFQKEIGHLKYFQKEIGHESKLI